jgi:HEAT repeat protein
MECRELTERVIGRLHGEADEPSLRSLSEHLSACAACAVEAERIERSWDALGREPEPRMTESFRQRSLQLLEEEMLRQRIRNFRPRPRALPILRYAAAVLLAGAAGYLLRAPARTSEAPAVAASAPSLAPSLARAPMPDFAEGPRLSNVAYTAPDAEGRIGIAFDTTSRQTVKGRPDDPAISQLLAYLVSRNAETAGEKSRAIELLSTHYGTAQSPASPDIVRALTSTLRADPNPGVRKKAADALAGFRMTPEIRAAFLDALRSDKNPAVRLAAVDVLAAAAKEGPPDEQTIESLRQKAFDPTENGFVRAKAASALKAIDL